MLMNRPKSRFLIAVLGTLALSGCMVGPNYERPVVEVPDVWQQAATANVEEGEAPLQMWWAVFDDPKLESLIERAQAANLDLKQAVWRIQEASAIRGIATGELLPTVEGTGDLKSWPI